MEYQIYWLLFSLAFVMLIVFRKFIFGYKDSDYVGMYVIMNQEHSSVFPGELSLRVEGVITHFKTSGENIEFTVVELDEAKDECCESKYHKFVIDKREGDCYMTFSTVLSEKEYSLKPSFSIDSAERVIM